MLNVSKRQSIRRGGVWVQVLVGTVYYVELVSGFRNGLPQEKDSVVFTLIVCIHEARYQEGPGLGPRWRKCLNPLWHLAIE